MQIGSERNVSNDASKNPCRECGGAGFFRLEVPRDHPKFGRLEPCGECNQATVTLECGLREHERGVRLDGIEADPGSDTAAMVYAARRFVERPVGFLSIHGTYGNAKTLALQGIVNYCVEAGIEARYVTGHEISLYLREAFDPSVLETDVGRIAKLARIPVLCIDEFDKLQDTPYVMAMQQHLVNERYRNADQRGTVFAWNGTLRSLPWPAVVSRMQEFCVVSNLDADLRPMLGERVGSLYHPETEERLE